MKKTGPPGPRPKPRKRRKKPAEPAEQYTLYHQDVVVGSATYRVFLKVPREELSVVVSAAVAAHIGGSSRPMIIGVRAEVKEVRDVKRDPYKEEA